MKKKKKKQRISLYAYKQGGEKELPQTVLPYRFPDTWEPFGTCV